jgi:two-component system chemotaxis sensor kinase CheA
MDDDLVTEFIAETAEGLSELDTQLIELEQNPSGAEIIGGIFRIVHTIK